VLGGLAVPVGPHTRAVVFDVGNTLLHVDYAHVARVLGDAGHAVDADGVRRAEYAAKAALDRALAPETAREPSVQALLWRRPDGRPSYFATVLASLGIPDGQVAPALATLEADNRAASLWRVVAAGTGDVLATLRGRGYALGVISNSDGRIAADLAAAGLAGHFACILDSAVVGVEKPDARIFAMALARLGVRPEEAVYVGDVYAIDVLGARRAGIEAVLMDPLGCYAAPADCARIRTLADLLPLLPRTATSG
jgi:putative hydrolase of the HAD superfamily